MNDMNLLFYLKIEIINSIFSINHQIEDSIIFILVTIISLLPVLAFIVVLVYYKQSEIFREGAGKNFIIGFFSLTLAITINFISFIEEGVFIGKFYQNLLENLYLQYIVFFIAGVFLILGFYRQYIFSEKLYKELKESNKLLNKQKDELSDFAHEMRHDLNNFILNIAGYASLLKKQPEVKDIKYVEKITEISEKMSEFLTKSLELAESGNVIDKSKINNLNEIFTNIKQMYSYEKVKIEIDERISNKSISIYCDKEKCYQLFKNIIENAIIHGKANNIIIEILKTPKEIELHIKNNGILIEHNIRERMWNKGFSSKDNSGLGLNISKKIVEGHGWNIKENNKDNGVDFVITIPLKDIDIL